MRHALGRMFAALLACAAVGMWPHAALGAEKPVYVEICVMEVNVSNLKSLGFDWDGIVKSWTTPSEESQESEVQRKGMHKFVEALAKDNLGRVQARPKMMTESGREASMEVLDKDGMGIKLAVTPQAVDDQNIKLRYRLQVIEPVLFDEKGRSFEKRGIPPGKRSLQADTTVDLKAGETSCQVLPVHQSTDRRGKTQQIANVVLIRADVKPPEEIRTAEKPAPMPSGIYREVPRR